MVDNCPTDTARCSLLSGCLVSGGDERLRKCAILSGYATVGTRANNGLRVHHSFSKLKNLTNKSFAKSRMRLY